MTKVVPIFLIVCAVAALAIVALLIRLGSRMHQRDRRLGNELCPGCKYPLRFNGSEHWCSECGYKHPVSTDRPDA